MTLSFFSCSRSAFLCSIIIFAAFFVFGQIGITHATTPVPPTPTYPANTWTNTIPSGSITFQWSYSGDTTNIWFYFFMYKWDFQQGKWVVVASEYAKTNTYDTQFLADGYYAWRVAAVDILQQDPNNWYQWNTDWVKLQLLTTVIPTAVPTSTYTATPTPTPAESPTPTSTPCPGTCPTYYISPTGSNSNNGTSVSTPWKTFAYAIPKLQPGDTLKLLNGTYLVSDSGMINIDCKVNAKNGLLSSPITIQAQNERQAFVWGDGITPSVRMNNCSYWNIIGLHLEARDNEAVTNNSSAVMDLNYDTHANVKRIVLAHNNRMALGSISLITSGNLSDVLFEDNEFYYFTRYGLGSNPSNHIVLRRNYFNATGYCDITAAGQPLYPSGTSTRAGRASGAVCNGDGGFNFYESSYSTAENNISEHTMGIWSWNNYSGTVTDNKFYGNIVNDEAYGIMANLGNPAQNTQTNFYAENNVSIGGKYTDFYLRSQTNAQLVNNTAINSHSSGFTADKQDKYPGSPSTFCTNCLAVSNAGTGFSWSGQGTWKIDYSNSYGNGTNYSPAMPNANITNSMSINPNLGACKVYIPAGSPMKGKGKNGADIGANIIYRYQGGENGTAVYLNTAQKLWNQSTGQFPCGATVNTSGLNTTDLNGATKSTEACINVNKRLNVGVNGCPIP